MLNKVTVIELIVTAVKFCRDTIKWYHLTVSLFIVTFNLRKGRVLDQGVDRLSLIGLHNKIKLSKVLKVSVPGVRTMYSMCQGYDWLIGPGP